MMMVYQTISLNIVGRIANVTLNRPDRLNALNETMLEEILDVLEKIGANEEVTVMTLTGAGRGFCAGVDTTSPFFMQPGKDGAPTTGVKFTKSLFWQHKMINGLRNLPQVTIASINGVCVGGGGFGMAMACDMRVASENALFFMVPAKMAVIQDFAILWFLERLIGTAKTFEILMTGDRVTGSEAAKLGFVNKTVPPEKLQEATEELAEKVAAGGPLAWRLAKQFIYRGLSLSLADELDVEAIANGLLAMTEDSKEGQAAFFAKRKPVFKGK
jgi:2-(1,2-epoxy-1,2-dihydrophenyl)acetyl-CoA isomerase